MNIFLKKPNGWKELIDQSHQVENFDVADLINQKLNMFDINKDTIDCIRESSKYLTPYKDELIDRFYQNILSEAHLKGIINKYSSVEQLAKTMALYIEQFLEAKIDNEYIKSREVIGKVHSRIHLSADHFLFGHHL